MDGGGGKATHAGNLVHLVNSVVFRSLSSVAPSLHFSGDNCHLIHIVCRSIHLSIYFAISILFVLLSCLRRLPLFPPRTGPSCGGGGSLPPRADSTSAGRALCHVLSAVAGVPVASRKYDLVRSLAERILDDNLCFRNGRGPELCDLNRAPLCTSFAWTIGLLEEALAAGRASPPWNGPGGSILGVFRSVTGIWAAPAPEGEPGRTAEKLAAEALWLGQKMAENGSAAEAVAMWGEAWRLAALAVSAEPRLQVAFVRVCAFMFKQANSRKLEEGAKGGRDAAMNCPSSHLPLLKSWLPLLCRASSGVDAPALSGSERAETVHALEGLISRLHWEEQESILALWLHHFTASPDSDWPNLETCYMRWYSESRKCLSKERKGGGECFN